VFCARISDLLQRLQAARRDLTLKTALPKLDKFDLIILDDVTHAHKDQAETGVLFEPPFSECQHSPARRPATHARHV